MLTPQQYYLATMEILRKHKQPGAVSQSDKVDFQRQRSANTNHLDWACGMSRFLDDLPFAERQSMEAVFFDQVEIKSDKSWALRYADDGLEKWFKLIPKELLDEGVLIVKRVL